MFQINLLSNCLIIWQSLQIILFLTNINEKVKLQQLSKIMNNSINLFLEINILTYLNFMITE